MDAITAETTLGQLAEYYGAENVKKDSIPLGEDYFFGWPSRRDPGCCALAEGGIVEYLARPQDAGGRLISKEG